MIPLILPQVVPFSLLLINRAILSPHTLFHRFLRECARHGSELLLGSVAARQRTRNNTGADWCSGEGETSPNSILVVPEYHLVQLSRCPSHASGYWTYSAAPPNGGP